MSLGDAVMTFYAKLGLDDKEYKEGMEGAKEKGKGFASFLKNVGKIATTAFAAVGTATVAMGKQAVDAYSKYEQLAGGIQKLFGEEGAGIVAQYAEQAFLTSGKSINEYYDSVSQITASLKRSIGDDMNEVARVADVAMQVISDNVNTFGSDAGFVENAIMGLSRNNYMMIDNLKLGYAGTAQGMLELINDSGILGKKLKDTSELANVGFDKMILAIQKIQEEQGIAGTTAKEALTTIEGAGKATASAWKNVITAIGRGEGLNEALGGLSTAIFGNGLTEDGKETGLANQIIPRIQTAMESIGEFVVQAGPMIAQKVPEILKAVVPAFAKTVTGLVTKIGSFIFEKIPDVMSYGTELLASIGAGIQEGIPKLAEQGLPMLLSFVEGLRENFGVLVDSGIQLLMNIVNGIVEALPSLIEYVPLIISNIAGLINDNAPKLLEAGFNIIVTLGKGLIDNIPVIVENAGAIFQAIIDVVQAINWIDLGGKIITLIGNGLKALATAPVEIIRNIGKNVFDTFKKGFSWSSLGKDIINGIVEGIKSVGSSIGDTVMGFAKNAFSGIKSFFKIGSPSKLMRDEIGKWIPEGIAEGIKLNEGSVFDAMSEIPDIASSGYNSGNFSYDAQPTNGGTDLSVVISLLQQIANNGLNVTLEGDANQMFRVVRKQAINFEKAKGYSAI